MSVPENMVFSRFWSIAIRCVCSCFQQVSTKQKLLSSSDPQQMTSYLTNILTFYLAFSLTYIMTFYLAFYLAYILTFYLTFYLTYILTFYLAFLSDIHSDILSGILSDIHSDILSDILSDIHSDILSGILSGISIWHTFWHSIWHSIWHTFWHSIWHSILTYILTFYLERVRIRAQTELELTMSFLGEISRRREGMSERVAPVINSRHHHYHLADQVGTPKS